MLDTYDTLDWLITQMLACGMGDHIGPFDEAASRAALNAYAHTARQILGPLPTHWTVGTELDASDHPVQLMQRWAEELGPNVRASWDGWRYDYTPQRRLMHTRILAILDGSAPTMRAHTMANQ